MLADILPALKESTSVDEMHPDDGYNSPEVERLMREHHVVQVQTAIRGRQPDPEKLNPGDFTWELDPDGHPIAQFDPPPSAPPASIPATKAAPPPCS